MKKMKMTRMKNLKRKMKMKRDNMISMRTNNLKMNIRNNNAQMKVRIKIRSMRFNKKVKLAIIILITIISESKCYRSALSYSKSFKIN